jgi:hypothetical protein
MPATSLVLRAALVAVLSTFVGVGCAPSSEGAEETEETGDEETGDEETGDEGEIGQSADGVTTTNMSTWVARQSGGWTPLSYKQACYMHLYLKCSAKGLTTKSFSKLSNVRFWFPGYDGVYAACRGTCAY